jgi:O-acetyl-ADP-ribose deacetylase (regulator of RNase III)
MGSEQVYELDGVRYVVGDATEPIGDGIKFICHIVNDVGAWGAGFTAALDRKWPELGDKYEEWSTEETFKLGRFRAYGVNGDTVVLNLLAQHGLRSAERPCVVDYRALAECMLRVRVAREMAGASLHMPKIGTGLAGGDWSKIAPLVVGATVYVLDPREIPEGAVHMHTGG